jgi:hypothetical protein
MVKKLKNVGFILLALLILAPTIVKLGHHHQEFHCNAKNVKHFHSYHQNCEICQFDFSVFTSEDSNLVPEKEKYQDSFNNQYSFTFFSNQSKFSFLLRAPPAFTSYFKNIYMM